MSIKVVISADVKDFDSFSKVFNSEGPQNARKEAGFIAEDHKNLDNPTNAVVIGTVDSKESFQAFFNTPEQAERMKNAGIVSEPKVTFLAN